MITIRKDHYLLIQWIKWNNQIIKIVEDKKWKVMDGLNRMIELGLINNNYEKTPLYNFILNKYSSFIEYDN